jgi:undecaprenyl-diphosphatase
LAELLKLVMRRHRPSPVNDGQHVYDWFGPHVEGRGLGLASSHTAVAFGAAAILWMWSPRAGVLAGLLACGCAMTRMFAGAHFLSDVYAGAVLGWLGATIVWRTADRIE